MRRMYSKPQLLEAVEEESKLNGIKVFEDIKDKDGHARFIEGDIQFETISGVTSTYAKWSLSGSHLLIVACGTIENASPLSYGTLGTLKDLPTWIFDKITPLASTYIDSKQFAAYSDDYTTSQTWTTYITKSSGVIKLVIGALTTTAKRNFRIAYDILIDNE